MFLPYERAAFFAFPQGIKSFHNENTRHIRMQYKRRTFDLGWILQREISIYQRFLPARRGAKHSKPSPINTNSASLIRISSTPYVLYSKVHTLKIVPCLSCWSFSHEFCFPKFSFGFSFSMPHTVLLSFHAKCLYKFCKCIWIRLKWIKRKILWTGITEYWFIILSSRIIISQLKVFLSNDICYYILLHF